MSPITDDVVLFTALAAGLRPVMAPVSAEDGNIDLSLVPDQMWSSIGGVLTTNLYGLPDRVNELRSQCDQLRIPLIEDGAHAIETTVTGRPIGTFGDAAAFSLSKHVGAGAGGILAFSDEALRPDLERLRDMTCLPGRSRDHLKQVATHSTEPLVIGLHLVWPVRWLRRTLGLVERHGYRMPLRTAELRRAIAAAPSLEAFHSWVRSDLREYRQQPPRLLLETALRRLRHLDADRARRIEGVYRLRAHAGVAPAVRAGDPQPLFRVPVLADDRDAMLHRLERHILSTGYVYDPPLDDYAGPEFVEPSPSPDAARSWARAVFPVDPLEADRFMRYMEIG